MRKRFLLAAVMIPILAVSSALADDGVAPPVRDEASVNRHLAETPMACLMPSLPSLLPDNATTPVDFVKVGAVRLNDFVQNTAIYMNCIGNKIIIAANIVYQKLLAAARAKINGIQRPKRNPAL